MLKPLRVDEDTVSFIVQLLAHLPQISSAEMRKLCFGRMAERVALLKPTLRDFAKSHLDDSGIDLIEVAPQWDFLIMRCPAYPEVGIAVSDRSQSLGHGFRVAFAVGSKNPTNNEWEIDHEYFGAPCGCCNWYLPGTDVRDMEAVRHSLQLVLNTCKKWNISRLLMTHWLHAPRETQQGVGGLVFVDPYKKDEMDQMLDKARFIKAFGALISHYSHDGLRREDLGTLFS